jgi:peptide/nickel transport system substrate-binding protein
MKKFRWQLLIIFLTGLVVGILLLGEQPQQASSPLSSPEPVKGGVYTEALVGSLMRLNPLLSSSNAPDRDVNRLIYSGLIRFDSNGSPQPDLAESWAYSKDGTVYTITLRKNARWHDNQPVTADDVTFTVDLMRKGGDIVSADLQNFWKDIEVVKLDNLVVQFRLPEAYAPFPDYLTFAVLPKHLLDGKTVDQMVDLDFNLHPVGTGPFKFEKLLTENGQITGVVLEAFKDYYAQKPYIEEIVFRYYPDSKAALQAYHDSQVQGIGQVTEDILPKVLAEPKLHLYTAREPEMSMVMFNLNNPEAAFFQDANVRQALLAGINRQAIVDRLLKGQAIVADGPILPGTWAYYEKLEPVKYDPAAAQALLKEAGYTFPTDNDVVRKKGDVALRFHITYPDDDEHQLVAEAIKKNWIAIGVDAALDPVPYDILLNERLAKRDFEAVMIDLNLSQTPDPDPYPFWDQGQATTGQNYTQWTNRIASEYLEQARVTVNLQDRVKYYRNFQILFMQELPALPLYYPVYTYAVDQGINGIQVGPLFDTSDRFANVTEWFLPGNQGKENVVAPINKP